MLTSGCQANGSVKLGTFDEVAPVSDADGKALMALIEELFPICRSITGNGVRQTLGILQRYIRL